MESFLAGILVLLLVSIIFVLPVIAFITAITTNSSVKKLRIRIDTIERNLEFLRKKMMNLEKGLKEEKKEEIVTEVVVKEEISVLPESQPSPPKEPAPLPVQTPIPATPATEPFKAAAPPKVEEKESSTVEELLSAKLFVWLGAIALLLATIFLIKYSFDKGWVTPPLRVAMGYFFGIAFLGLGEYLSKRSNYVSQGFSSAGIGVIYAATLAGVNLYHLISPFVGFGLMSITTVTAIILSIQRGPIIAVIGLLGGFLTPYWLRTGTPRPQALFSYLFLLELALFYTARKKKWLPLAFFAVSGGFLWVVTWFYSVFTGADSLWIGLFLIASTAALLLFTFSGTDDEEEKRSPVSYPLQILFAGIATVLMAVLCAKTNYSNEEWVFFGILTLGTMGLGYFKDELKAAPFVSLIVSSVLFITWPLDGVEAYRYLTVIAVYGAIYGLTGYIISFLSKSPQFWAFLSSYAGIQLLLIAYGKAKIHLSGFSWGITAFAVSLICAVFAYSYIQKDQKLFKGATGWMAAGASVQLSLAIAFSFKEAWWSAGWGLAAPLLLYIAYRYEIKTVKIWAVCLTIATMARLVLNPYIFKYPVGDTPVFNWLLYGFGIPLLSFIVSAWIALKNDDEKLSSIWQISSTILALALGFLQIHHIMNGKIDISVSTLWEWGWMVTYSLCVGLTAYSISERFKLKALEICSGAVFVLTVIIGGAATMLAQNPLFSHQDVGRTILFNRLILIYLVPSLLLLFLGSKLKTKFENLDLGIAAYFSSFIFFLVFVTLEIRQAFQGTYLDGHGITNPEKYTYSIVFILLGIILALVGMFTGNKFARYASLALMLAAIFKVFLYDVSALKGILRPLSFFGLGFALLLLAFLYRKFVFGFGKK